VKVVCCIPTLRRPHAATLDALERSYASVTAAGWEFHMVAEIGNVYISAARSIMLTKALDAGADVVVFVDHDMSWAERDLLTLIETPGDVVAGTYRYKKDEPEFMGVPLTDSRGVPLTRDDGCIEMKCIPAGFLKVTRAAVERFKAAYPHLIFGRNAGKEYVDLFNHGAHNDVWFGEDYAFSRNWNALGGSIWVIPTLDLVHHAEDKSYGGTYHEHLLALPGGSHHKEAA
jgi:hypothetical protein